MSWNQSYIEISSNQLMELRNALDTSEHVADILGSCVVTLAAICGCAIFYSSCLKPRKAHPDPVESSPKLQDNKGNYSEIDEKSSLFDDSCDNNSPICFEPPHPIENRNGYTNSSSSYKRIVNGQSPNISRDYREMSADNVISRENTADEFSMAKVYFKSSNSYVEPADSQITECKVKTTETPYKYSPAISVPHIHSPSPLKLIPSTPYTLSINPTIVNTEPKVLSIASALKRTNWFSSSRKRISTYSISRAQILDVFPENFSSTKARSKKRCRPPDSVTYDVELSTASSISKLCKFNGNSLFLGNCYATLTDHQQRVLRAIREDRCNVLKLYKKTGMRFDFNENNPLREAVLSNKIEILKYLHEECGVDLNAESGFAIRWASRRNHVEMVRWLCSIESLDVLACKGEALAWAREKYNITVQEIIKARIKKQKLGNIINRKLDIVSRKKKHGKIDTRLKYTRQTTETMELVVENSETPAIKRRSVNRLVRDVDGRLNGSELNITRERTDRSESTQHFAEEGVNESCKLSSTPIEQKGIRPLILTREKAKAKNVFAKPVGRGSRSRSRKRIRKLNKSAGTDSEKVRVPSGKGSTVPVVDSKGLPLATPRTKLKHHCLNAAGKLGTLPCGPPTEHRRKIARIQDERKQKENRKRSLSDSNPPEKHGGKPSQKSSNEQGKKGDVVTEKSSSADGKYDSPPRVKRRKIRPRSDGPITRTQQRAFMDFRDHLFKKGLMSKQIRMSLEQEEVDQMVGEKSKLRR